MSNESEDVTLAGELEALRDDPDEWSDAAAEFNVRPRRTEVVSFRLPQAELDELEAAADAAGESLSEFIRGAVELRLGKTLLDDSLLDVWAGSGTLVIRRLHRALGIASRSENQGFVVPDFPPALASMIADPPPDHELPLEYS